MKLKLFGRTIALTVAKQRKRTEGLALAIESGAHKFYLYPSIPAMPSERVEYFLSLLHRTSVGMVHEDLVVYQDMIKTKCNEGAFADVASLNNYLGIILDEPINLKPSMYCAGALLLLDDEPEGKILPEYQAKKLEIVQNDEKVKTFFLTIFEKLMKEYDKSVSSTEFWEILMNPSKNQIEQAFLTMINNHRSTITTSEGTKNIS